MSSCTFTFSNTSLSDGKNTWKKTNFKEYSMKISKYFSAWSPFIEKTFVIFQQQHAHCHFKTGT
jgi:hypothetical protein